MLRFGNFSSDLHEVMCKWNATVFRIKPKAYGVYELFRYFYFEGMIVPKNGNSKWDIVT